MPCVFCDNQDIQKREILRNEHVRVFPTNIPIVPGHVLIVTTRHVQKFAELTDQERQAMNHAIQLLEPALEELFGAEGFNFAWNEGESAGQSVPHFHLHLLPRKVGDSGILEYEPRKFLYRPGSRTESPEAELAAVAEMIKSRLFGLD